MQLKSETKYNFSADINQLMHLIVNAFYSKKEVFLRELLSNASDALDKIRYESLTNKDLLDQESRLVIQIIPNKDNKTLTITDTGIGMTKSDLIENLGTVAKSGTKSFMEYLKKSNNDKLDLIGQFGVGFYSAYLVADKVSVVTKNSNDIHYLWQSDANGSFTISELNESDLKRGTSIVLHLKDEALEYLEEDKLKELVKTHSQYINFPIELYVEKEVSVKKEEDLEEKQEEVDLEEKQEKQEKQEQQEQQEQQKETKLVQEFEVLNDQKPIWTRPSDQVTQEEYQTFYKNVSGDYGEFSQVKHFSVEGNVEFSSLLFMPKHKPFDLFNGGEDKLHNKIKLYVRRVFILDNCKDLLPEYLNFVVGVVDSNDLPLNVSREMVQENAILRVIKKQLVKKSIEMISELSEREEEFKIFYQGFSKNLKLGVYEDSKNREKLASLLRFSTTSNEFTSLDQYLERMKEGQDKIYYLAGENIESLRNSPYLEQLQKRGYEVLFMTEAIDEYMVQSFKDFKDKKLVDITKEELDFAETDEEKKEREELESSFKDLCDFVKETLGEKVSKVSVSNRIVDSSCVLSSSKQGWSANMERIMKAQALHDDTMSQYMKSQKIFEINPNSSTIKSLKIRFDKDKSDPTIKDLVWLLYESAVIGSGFTLENPMNFTKRLNKIINLGLGVEDDEEEQIEDLEDLDINDEEESNMEQVD
jgi:molecular chaperone HtpG